MVIVTIDRTGEEQGATYLELEIDFMAHSSGVARYATGESLSDAYKFESAKDALIHIARAAGQGCIDELDPEYPDDELVIRITDAEAYE